MNSEDIKNQALNKGIEAINSIKKFFNPQPTPQPQPQMSRVQPIRPSTVRSELPKAPSIQERNAQFIKNLNPINRPIMYNEGITFNQVPGVKPLTIKPTPAPTTPKIPQAQRQQQNFDSWMGAIFGSKETDPLLFQLDKFKTDISSFLTDTLGPAIKDYTLKKAQYGTFETLGAPAGFQEGEKLAGELRATVKGPEALATKELAEAELFTKKAELGIKTVTGGLNVVNKAFIQPIYQNTQLAERERDLGIKPTPEELRLASLGELNKSKNDLYNKKFENVPAEFYLPNTSDAYIKKKQELGLTDQEIEKRKANNTEWVLNEVRDVLVELIDPSLFIPGGKAATSTAKVSVKGPSKLNKLKEVYEAFISTTRMVLADNKGFIDADKFTDLFKGIMKDDVAKIEKEIGRKLTKEEIAKMKALEGLPAVKKFYDKLRSGKIAAKSSPISAKGVRAGALKQVLEEGKIIVPVKDGTRQISLNRYSGNKKEIAKAILGNQEEIVKRTKGPMTLKGIEQKAKDVMYPISNAAKEAFEKLGTNKMADDIAVQVLRNDMAAREILAKEGAPTKEFFDTLMRSQNVKTGTAQLLNSYKASAKRVKDMDAVDRINLLQSKLKDLDNYETKYKEMVEYAVKNKIDLNNAEEFNKLYRQFVPASIWEWLEKIGYNSMLSGLTSVINSGTLVSSLVWNTSMYTIRGLMDSGLYLGQKLIGKQGMLPPKYNGWSGLGYLKSSLTQLAKESKGTGRLALDIIKGVGNGTKGLMDDGFALVQGKAIPKNKKYFGGLSNAFKKFDESVSKSFQSVVEDERAPLSTAGTLARSFENLLDVPQYLFGAIDGFIGNVLKAGFDGAINPAYKKAIGKDLDALKALDLDTTNKTLQGILRGELDEKGLGYVNDLFGAVGRGLNTLKYGGPEPVRFLVNSIIPFVKVPINYIRQGLEATPLGAFNLIGSKDKVDVLAKLVTGSLFGMQIQSMYSQGKITGGYPTDKATRDMWKEYGIQPYSVAIDMPNGKRVWVDYTKYAPQFSVLMGTTANANDAYRRGEITDQQYEKVLMYTTGLFNYMTDQSFVDNFRIFKDLSNESFRDQAGNELGVNLTTQRIPFFGLTKWAGRYTNAGVLKDPQTFLETLMKDVPGLQQQVPNKYDEEGQLIINPYFTYNSAPIFGRATEERETGFTNARLEKEQEQYFTRSKNAIQKMYADENNRVLSGLQTDLNSGEAAKYLDDLNAADDKRYYYFEPNVKEVRVIDFSFLNERPQNTEELMKWTKKYNDTKEKMLIIPFIPDEDISMLYNRLSVPDNERVFPTVEYKNSVYEVPVKEEKQKKPQATPEQRKEQSTFAQQDENIKLEMQDVRAGRKLTSLGTGKGKGRSRLKAKKPTLKTTKLKLPKVPKAKKIKLAKLKVPTPKKPIKRRVNI